MKPVRNQELENQITAVETDPKINLKVPFELKNPHHLIKGLQMHSTKSWINQDSQKAFPEKKNFDVIVGKPNINRAKLILSTFFKAIEGRGHSIMFEKDHSYLEAFGEKLRIRFWEKSRYIGSPDRNSYRDMELTGILSFQYFRILNYVEREWADTPHTKLEEKLGRIIGSLEFYAQKEKAERLEREQRWREQKIREEIIREVNTRKEAEFKKFQDLLTNSLRWEKAQSIRAYLNHIHTNQPEGTESENRNEWVAWANDKADWFDPFVSKPDPLLKPFGEFHESLLDQSIKIDRYNIDKL